MSVNKNCLWARMSAMLITLGVQLLFINRYLLCNIQFIRIKIYFNNNNNTGINNNNNNNNTGNNNNNNNNGNNNNK